MPFRPTALRVHPVLDEVYAALEREARERHQPAAAVRKSLQTFLARIRVDGQWGEVIPPERIPRYFLERYAVSNLYCVDLAPFHRGFYTLFFRDVILLDIVDHPMYDKWFPGRRGR